MALLEQALEPQGISMEQKWTQKRNTVHFE